MNAFIRVKKEHVAIIREILIQEDIESTAEMKSEPDTDHCAFQYTLFIVTDTKENIDRLTTRVEPYGTVHQRTGIILLG